MLVVLLFFSIHIIQSKQQSCYKGWHPIYGWRPIFHLHCKQRHKNVLLITSLSFVAFSLFCRDFVISAWGWIGYSELSRWFGIVWSDIVSVFWNSYNYERFIVYNTKIHTHKPFLQSTNQGIFQRTHNSLNFWPQFPNSKPFHNDTTSFSIAFVEHHAERLDKYGVGSLSMIEMCKIPQQKLDIKTKIWIFSHGCQG